jgi:hypothetical protein
MRGLGGRLPNRPSFLRLIAHADDLVRPRYSPRVIGCWLWRYPVKPPKAQMLDHTRLRGKNRAKYPVTNLSVAGYALAEWPGHYDKDGYPEIPPPTSEQIARAARIWGNRQSKPELTLPGAHPLTANVFQARIHPFHPEGLEKPRVLPRAGGA